MILRMFYCPDCKGKGNRDILNEYILYIDKKQTIPLLTCGDHFYTIVRINGHSYEDLENLDVKKVEKAFRITDSEGIIMNLDDILGEES